MFLYTYPNQTEYSPEDTTLLFDKVIGDICSHYLHHLTIAMLKALDVKLTILQPTESLFPTDSCIVVPGNLHGSNPYGRYHENCKSFKEPKMIAGYLNYILKQKGIEAKSLHVRNK